MLALPRIGILRRWGEGGQLVMVVVIVRFLFFIFFIYVETVELVSCKEFSLYGICRIISYAARKLALFVGLFVCSILLICLYVCMYCTYVQLPDRCLPKKVLCFAEIRHSFFSTSCCRQPLLWVSAALFYSHCSHYLSGSLSRISFVLSLDICGNPTYLLIQLITA